MTCPLTPRERQVMMLCVLDHHNRHIAAVLTISIKTVEAHLRNIENKLGTRRQLAIALFTQQHVVTTLSGNSRDPFV